MDSAPGVIVPERWNDAIPSKGLKTQSNHLLRQIPTCHDTHVISRVPGDYDTNMSEGPWRTLAKHVQQPSSVLEVPLCPSKASASLVGARFLSNYLLQCFLVSDGRSRCKVFCKHRRAPSFPVEIFSSV